MTDLINYNIKFKEILLIGDDGTKIGKMSPSEAMKHAEEKDLDLVCINSKSDCPVCKIMDYSKYKYEKSKQLKQQKKANKQPDHKEIQLSFTIESGDIDIKIKRAEKFLLDGDYVKIVMRLKGRQMAFKQSAENKFRRFVQRLNQVSTTNKPIVMIGNTISCELKPNVSNKVNDVVKGRS